MRIRDFIEILGAVGMTIIVYTGVRLVFDAVLSLLESEDPRS